MLCQLRGSGTHCEKCRRRGNIFRRPTVRGLHCASFYNVCVGPSSLGFPGSLSVISLLRPNTQVLLLSHTHTLFCLSLSAYEPGGHAYTLKKKGTTDPKPPPHNKLRRDVQNSTSSTRREREVIKPNTSFYVKGCSLCHVTHVCWWPMLCVCSNDHAPPLYRSNC